MKSKGFSKFLVILSMTILLFNSIFQQVTEAMTDQITVRIPQFSITINGKKINCTNMKYPPIMYKDITYIPLSWEWCIELGLTSGYTYDEGLYIANYSSTNLISAEMDAYKNAYRYDKSYYASLADYSIHINGQLIDNNLEKYPPLNFHNVTYIPLTWNCVVNEFGWHILWDDDTGLILETEESVDFPGAGENFYINDFYIRNDYNNYMVIEKNTNTWKVGTVQDEFGNYSHQNISSHNTFYKFDYETKGQSVFTINEPLESPYDSGRTAGEVDNEHFKMVENVIYFDEYAIPGLLEDNEKVYGFGAHKYTVNHMDIYSLTLTLMENDNLIPAPYTPLRSYVFVDKKDGSLQRIANWPTYHRLNDVYPCGSEGIYLCSNSRYFTTPRYNNHSGWVTIINADMTETSLGSEYDDWNSLVALGMDEVGNLYLLNTWYPEYESPNLYTTSLNGTVSVVKDGFYRLSPKGEMKKLCPFIATDQVIVNPDGDLYATASWINRVIHLQTYERFELQ